MPNDKTCSIPLHETWPGVPGPSCLGPWTGNQEPVHYRTIEQAPSFCLQRCLGSVGVGWFGLGRGPWIKDQKQVLLGPFATVEPQDHGPGAPIVGPRALDHGAFTVGMVDSFGISFIW